MRRGTTDGSIGTPGPPGRVPCRIARRLPTPPRRLGIGIGGNRNRRDRLAQLDADDHDAHEHPWSCGVTPSDLVSDAGSPVRRRHPSPSTIAMRVRVSGPVPTVRWASDRK